MPTNRMRRKRVRESMTDEQKKWLYDAGEVGRYSLWIFFESDDGLRDLWVRYGEEVMAWWIKNRPCTRPLRWWEYQAPRQPDQGSGGFWEGKLPVPRQRIGGEGQTNAEKYPAWLPSYFRGIPDSWFEIDYDDPPVYESEASYLQRHSLLMESERQYLEKHPELLEPEKIVITENY